MGLPKVGECDFVENQDFVRFYKKMEANNATLIEYYITLDMAKNSVGWQPAQDSV